ncbi:FAD binding domain-containing protein [Xylaria bambusicola]|uniref:FAD binding domain-containing protein n=1 Tax=Xylaria bambusicola TaxID=326684 RepID=UPI0020071F0D|nr:FAD binding domain-containing protein [Xylaria bambusicola]KAI0509762.1 FAD binding domain-containing protein [Xylaria bambusicola]
MADTDYNLPTMRPQTIDERQHPEKYDVAIVGAGPAGLTLAVVLGRLGICTAVFDERPSRTLVGRADGIQPKTIETLQMLGLADKLLRDGVKVYDICMWRGSATSSTRRISRQVHYPASIVDLLHPYILLCHQGTIESVLIRDLCASGLRINRDHRFTNFDHGAGENSSALVVSLKTTPEDDVKHVSADYLVGCDGARSLVRQHIPGTHAIAKPQESYWGVLDGVLDTDFPDIWSKTVVFSEEHGSVLIIPRERNLTRIYIEMKSSHSVKNVDQTFVMKQAQLVLAPYRVQWRSVEWFGNYQVAQRVAARFSDPSLCAFIAGDASHTHSPKAAQGMNTSMHDSWNLGWKLNLSVRGFAKPALLESYEVERMKVAHDLINFDFEHANEIAGGNIERLADNFRANTRFIAGAGVEYAESIINHGYNQTGGFAKPGCTLPPSKATRYIDANPVDVQLDVPMLGQFRVYVVVPDLLGSDQKKFLCDLSDTVESELSFLTRLSRAASESYRRKPRPLRPIDVFSCLERYRVFSELFTFCLLTSTPKEDFELASLPSLFFTSPWTVYLDDVPHLDTKGLRCIPKWLGGLEHGEVAIVNVRPDGYVGSIKKWDVSRQDVGEAAAHWLDEYYDSFLDVPDGGRSEATSEVEPLDDKKCREL